MHKVSVIIPVYNGSQHISNVFKFMSQQTFKDFEVIFVVDKKTTDDSLEKIDEFRSKINEVKVIIQEDSGKLGGARNIGVKHSTGDIIWFLDVDDRPLPDFISDLVHIMDEHHADVVLCNLIRSFSLDVGEDFPPKKDYAVWVMDRDTALRKRLNEKLPVTAWSKIMTKELIVKNNIEFTHDYAEDVEFTYMVLSHSNVICYYEKPLYVYYQNSNSICNKDAGNNARGKAEVAAYGRLEDFFKSDKEFYGIFKKGSTKIRMRSAVHMDKPTFIEYSRSKECRDMIRRNLSTVSPEAILFKVFPGLYYSAVRLFLDKVYYKDGRWFTKV